MDPTPGSTLTVANATLTGGGDRVTLAVGDADPVAVPSSGDPVRVIVDGPVLEVFTGHATYAVGRGLMLTRTSPTGTGPS